MSQAFKQCVCAVHSGDYCAYNTCHASRSSTGYKVSLFSVGAEVRVVDIDELEEHAPELRHSSSYNGPTVDHGTLLTNKEP